MLQPIGFGTSYIRIERLMEKYPDKGLQLSSLGYVGTLVGGATVSGIALVAALFLR